MDWTYDISFCSNEYFATDPSSENNKIWKVTVTSKALQIECNGVEVLHLFYINTLYEHCTTDLKGKQVTSVVFSGSDMATRMFKSELMGK